MGKKSKKTTSETVYGNTTTANPYATSSTNNAGTVTAFNKGTAFDTINSFVNNNMSQLLNEYLNPSLDSATNQAKMNAFKNELNNASLTELENNVINPLSKRNMIRSSQATNMYNALAQNNANQISNYAQKLLANSQKDTASLLTNLMLMYMDGYSAINDIQRQSLATSQGNATRTQTTSPNDSLFDSTQMMKLVTQLAMLAAV